MWRRRVFGNLSHRRQKGLRPQPSAEPCSSLGCICPFGQRRLAFWSITPHGPGLLQRSAKITPLCRPSKLTPAPGNHLFWACPAPTGARVGLSAVHGTLLHPSRGLSGLPQAFAEAPCTRLELRRTCFVTVLLVRNFRPSVTVVPFGRVSSLAGLHRSSEPSLRTSAEGLRQSSMYSLFLVRTLRSSGTS